jgi:glucose-1-phosphate cytidylyltransferase
MNGGYFVFRQEIFDYIGDGEDLVAEPFQRLIDDNQLLAYRYEGFWMPMGSLKDLQNLQVLHDSGAQPWAHGSPSRRDNAPRVASTCLAELVI